MKIKLLLFVKRFANRLDQDEGTLPPNPVWYNRDN